MGLLSTLKGAALVATLVVATGCAPQRPVTIDVGALGDIDRANAVRAVNDWADRHAAFTAAGVDKPARQRFLSEAIPEILATLTLLGPGGAGEPASNTLLITGIGAPDLKIDVYGLPLHDTLEGPLLAGELDEAALIEIVGASAILPTVLQAQAAGDSAEGVTITTIVLGLAHDGDNLMLRN